MATAADRSVLSHFATIDDPLAERTKLHPLVNVLAVICGAETWDDIAAFGRALAARLVTFLDVRNGTPSHDTFSRVVAALAPRQFEVCFLTWVRAARPILSAQVLAVDGKTIRRSHARRRFSRRLIRSFASCTGPRPWRASLSC